MTIRHPGRWLVAILVLFAAASWLIHRAFDAASLTRTVWITYVVASLASLFIVSRRREARPGAVSIAATLVAAIVGSWLLEVVEVRWWVRWILLAVIAAPLMSIANAAFRADVRRAQRRRESQAAAIKQDVVDGKPVGPYTLYLRPFISTDRLMTQALPATVGAADQLPVHLDLETVLTRSLRDTAPLIGLGHAEEVDEGVARIVTPDDGWQDVVLALARGAELVVMLPLSRPSTTWELGQIVEKGLLRKTLFVMPEVPYQAPQGIWVNTQTADRVFDAGIREFSAEAHMLDLAREWLDAVDAAQELNIELPPLAAVGALFTIDAGTGRTKEIVPLGLSSQMRTMSYLRWSFARLGLRSSVAAATPDVEQAFAKAVFFGGPTLEFALSRVADGMALWGRTAVALRLLAKALDEGGDDASFVPRYIASLPTLLEDRARSGDAIAASRYRDFLNLVENDPRLAPLLTSAAS